MRQGARDSEIQEVGRDAWLVGEEGLALKHGNVISQMGFHSLRAVMKTYHFVLPPDLMITWA